MTVSSVSRCVTHVSTVSGVLRLVDQMYNFVFLDHIHHLVYVYTIGRKVLGSVS